MNKIKFAGYITLVVLLVGMFSVATAQKKAAAPVVTAPQPLPIDFVLNGTYTMTVNASEVSAGDFDFTSGTTFGRTWSGKTEGDLQGFMFVSMNYVAPMNGGFDLIDGDVSGAWVVTGGSWSKLIMVNGKYMGSVSGYVRSGQIDWNAKAHRASLNLQLVADSGTDAFFGSSGLGTFEGMLDCTGDVPAITGYLTLNY